ncbi:Uncharacterized protein FKW44_009351 [Caligus rogercresseyi]|uniref:Reverse transcriptase zinc-binding domain-containing protein n=1 Tax=Caligus rogercresseyi TaxID=217165 RepID=A0A7T8HF58_CALRO|nr:Uncharacterized protein FKW44_009351 [Caligus rogercresseyi]
MGEVSACYVKPFTNKSKEKVEEQLCSFCNDNTETSEHLFYECSAVMTIRKIVEPCCWGSLVLPEEERLAA